MNHIKLQFLAFIAIIPSCVGVKPTGPKIYGGELMLIEKPGFLGSRGLRVVGKPVPFSDGKCFLSLEASGLPLQGDEWPYLVELRFFASGSIEGKSLDAQMARKITVKYRIENSTSEVVGGYRFSTDWIRTAAERDRDFYYYPAPTENTGLSPFTINDEKPVRLYVVLHAPNSLGDEMSANISIRTGGTK